MNLLFATNFETICVVRVACMPGSFRTYHGGRKHRFAMPPGFMPLFNSATRVVLDVQQKADGNIGMRRRATRY